MKITVEYSAQLKRIAGTGSQVVEVDSDGSIRTVIEKVAGEHGDDFRGFTLNGTGDLQPTILLCVNDEQVSWASPPPLNDGDVVSLLSPIAGG